jgi:phosphatidylserine decarboxylase
MQTVWQGEVKADEIRRWEYPKETAPYFAKGEEIARFNMGSTVIVLHPQYAVDMREELVGQSVRMGQAIGD